MVTWFGDDIDEAIRRGMESFLEESNRPHIVDPVVDTNEIAR